MSTKNGGPAFPFEKKPSEQMRRYGCHEPIQYDGMTLRDYFAAKAMQAHISNVGMFFNEAGRGEGALAAYQWADAMLVAREQQ